MTGDSRTLLIVEDDTTLRDRLVRAMHDRGFDARAADAPPSLRAESPVWSAFYLSGEAGLTVIRGLKELDPATTVVVLTGYGSIATAVESMKLGAASYLTKPADADQIVAAFDGVQPTHDVQAQAPSLARVEWNTSARPDGLRRQCVTGGAHPRHSSAVAPAQAREISGEPLSGKEVPKYVARTFRSAISARCRIADLKVRATGPHHVEVRTTSKSARRRGPRH